MEVCPACHSADIRRSEPKTRNERLWKFFGRHTYRCRHCRWRGVLRVKRVKQAKLETWQKVLIAALLLITIFVLKRFTQ